MPIDDPVLHVVLAAPEPHRGRLMLQVAAGMMGESSPAFPGVELELPPGVLCVRESTGLPEFWSFRFSLHVMPDLHSSRKYGVLVSWRGNLVEQVDAGDEPLALFWQNLTWLLQR